jgi:5-methylcytosine-specific restriction endonuclease McrA
MNKVCSEECYRGSFQQKPRSEIQRTVPKKRPKRKPKKTGDPTTKTRKLVSERDGGYCRMCGRPATHLHHVYYRSEGRPGRHEPDNLITLCSDDHRKVHEDKRYWQPILLAALWLHYAGETSKVSVPEAERRVNREESH